MNVPLLCLLLLAVPSMGASAGTGFSQDSAFAVLRTIAGDIGPRPMGSPAEQRAMQYAIGKLHDAGCTEAYLMPMTVAEGVNTRSGIAIGMLRGRTSRIIIIGGHIDSAGPDVPGANDDGSGVACVLELARVLCQRQHESTLMFCCWGGEEQDLEGSKYFVDHFDKIDSVDLMIQIDMADGASYLEVDPDYRQISAPRWLTAATYQIFYDELHERGLVYPAASAAINAALGGASGSDHDAFLEKGIPAIDFTSDVNFPIHTPQDNLANFTPSGLKRTGDLVLKLVERFDSGVPSRSTEPYMIVQVGVKKWFVGLRILWTIIVLSVLLAAAAILVLRGRSLRIPGAPRKRIPGIKLIIYTLIIQIFIWESETCLGWVYGYRFPWVNHWGSIVILGLLSGALGLWFVLNISRLFRLSGDPFVFAWRALAMLVVLTILAALTGPKTAVFVACATCLMALAMIVRSAFVRLAFWVLSCLAMLRLVFFEERGLVQRLISLNTIHSFWGVIGYEFAFIAVFTVLSLPFVLGFAAMYRDAGKDLLFLKRFREKRWLAVILPALALMVASFEMQTPYGPQWFGRIVVRQDCTTGADGCTISVRSSEYLEGLVMTVDTGTVTYEGRENFFEYTPSHQHHESLCYIESGFVRGQDTGTSVSVQTLTRHVAIHSLIRPYKVQVRYSSNAAFDVSSPWASRRADRFERDSDRLRVFSWYSFPDTLIDIPVTFSLRDTQRIDEKIEVTYDTLAYPMHLSKPLTNFEMSTVVAESHEFGPRDDTTGTASRQP